MEFHGEVTHLPDAIRLDAWPLLVYAPEQWGDCVCTEDKGIPVAEIAAAHAGDLFATAERFGTSVEHVRQALAYELEQSTLDL